MFRIDNSSATTTEPTRGATGVNPDSYFSDQSKTKVPADWLNAVQNEIVNAVEASGLSQDKQDDTQLLQAVLLLIAEGNSFKPYMSVNEEYASGTDPQGSTAGSYVKRQLNSEKTNNISGASLELNQITLPEGTYQVSAWGSATRCSLHKIKLKNITDNLDVLIGSAEDDDDEGQVTKSVLNGQFVVSGGSKVFEIQHRCSSSGGFGKKTDFGDSEVYAGVELWKIA